MKKLLMVFLLLFSMALVACDMSIEDEPEEETQIFEVGQTVKFGDYKLGVVSVDNVKTIPALLSNYTTQNNFMCVLIYLYNGSNSTKIFSYTDFTVNLETVKYSSKATEAYYYAASVSTIYGSLYLSGTLSAGLGEYYYLVFETPSESTSDDYILEYQYRPTYSITSESILFNL